MISYLDEAVWGGHGLIAIPCIIGREVQVDPRSTPGSPRVDSGMAPG